MLINANELPPNSVIHADVCVIGSGPAGLTLGQEFLQSGRSVCILEAGGLEYDPAIDAFGTMQLEDCDPRYPNPRFTRTRSFAGSSHLWSIDSGATPLVRYALPDVVDFVHRPWVSDAQWEIGYEQMLALCKRAQQIGARPPMDFRPQAWYAPDRQPFEFPDDSVRSKMFTFADRDIFRVEIRAQLAASQTVNVYFNGSAVELLADPAGRTVQTVRIVSSSRNEHQVKAKYVVLATGAFEVPRLLLASNRVVPAGLGNASDQVGRHLVDHQLVNVGSMRPGPRGSFKLAGLYDQHQVNNTRVVALLQLSAKVQLTNQLLNTFFGLCARPRLPLSRVAQRVFGRPATISTSVAQAVRQFKPEVGDAARVKVKVLKKIRAASVLARNADDFLYQNLYRWPRMLPEYSIDHGGWFDDPRRDKGFHAFDVFQMCEQSPSADNRVTLSAQRDALDMPVGKVRLRWSDFDQQNIVRSQEIFGQALAAARVGELTMDCRGKEPSLRQLSAHHPAGTARMSTSARSGVVDPSCRVHGMDNLFVASSAVFPVSGAANPTLMIMALAVHIADEIKERLEYLPIVQTVLGV